MNAKKPNIIIIYTDQQRYDTLGVTGNAYIKTPNLDQLANSGTLFTNAFVTCPICVPSRISLFTGKYNHANLSYNNSRLICDNQMDFAGYLRKTGYRTGLSGKDHCFGRRLSESFDFVWEASHLGFKEPASEDEVAINKYRTGKFTVPFCEDPFPAEKNLTASIFNRGKQFIKESNEQPFFLWLSIPDPHPPYMVSEPFASMYRDVDFPGPVYGEDEMANKPYRQRMVVEMDKLTADYPTKKDFQKLVSIYYGMVSCIDQQVGLLLGFLKEEGLFENTIIVFTSDHGDYLGDHKMIRKGPHLYDSLTRVPLIFSFPGKIKQQVADCLVSNIDIFPTLFDIINLEQPDGINGRSFYDVVMGKSNKHREMVFMEHGGPGTVLQLGELSPDDQKRLKNSGNLHLCDEVYKGRTKGVRTEKWKLCITPNDVTELYNIESDPFELVNLANDDRYKEVICKLKGHILDWLIDTEYYDYI